ncbi:MAG: HAMP domain-containing sensor histidine kinase [Eubacteriales bacterium]|nr:HAMP domain-containing sensor histidine kinase [Eubacteriales bacterium]
MFKSIFTKYIAFITLLMAFSIALLVLTISTMLASYSADSKSDLMAKTADSVAVATEAYFHYSDGSDISDSFINDIKGIAEISDSLVYIVGNDGVLLVTNDDSFSIGNIMLDLNTVETIKANPDSYSISRINGTFDEQRYNIFRTMKLGGDDAGVIIISSLTNRDESLSGPMIRTILVASIWILLASCITVYILFQRITDPLKKLSEAAKAFAKGDFKKRVYVTGNDEVAELAGAFNNMAGVLEKNEELRNSFLGSVSHDLRTPMTVISGFVDGIRDGTIPPEKQDYYLGIISSEVRRLSRLVSSLLEISRIQSGERKLNYIYFNVSEKARQVLITFEKKIDEKHLEVEFNCPDEITVHADTDAVHQVLYNLMDNAVKFINQGGKLTVSIEQRNKKARISVRNTGEGIPTEELPHVFDRFYKSDRSRGLDKTGTGLGLYIAKTNINMHNEEITVQSKQGEFTEFSFTLPV